jgi:hypothetical protein
VSHTSDESDTSNAGNMSDTSDNDESYINDDDDDIKGISDNNTNNEISTLPRTSPLLSSLLLLSYLSSSIILSPIPAHLINKRLSLLLDLRYTFKSLSILSTEIWKKRKKYDGVTIDLMLHLFSFD